MLRKVLPTIALLSLLLTSWPVQAAEGPTQRLGTGLATAIAAAPNGAVIAVGSSIGVWFFTADTLAPLGFWDTGEWVTRVQYSTDGRYLRANDLYWEVGRTSAVPAVPVETAWLEHACSPNGRYCASLSSWSAAATVKDQDTLIDVAVVRTGIVHDMAWSADGQTLYAAGERVTAWAMPAGTLVAEKTDFFTGSMLWATWSPDGQTVVSDGGAWVTSTGIPTTAPACPETYWDFFWPPAVFDCHARRLAPRWWSGDTELIIYDDPQVSAYRTLEPHALALNTARLSLDGELLATSGQDAYVYACGPDDRRHQPNGHCERRIGYTRVWNADTFEMLAQLPVEFDVVALVPHGTLVLGLTATGLEAWNWQTGQKLWHLETVAERLVVSPTGAYAATSTGPVVDVWQMATGQLSIELRGHTEPTYSGWSRINMYDHRWPFGISPITSLAFSPDGTQLAASGDDGTVLIWTVP